MLIFKWHNRCCAQFNRCIYSWCPLILRTLIWQTHLFINYQYSCFSGGMHWCSWLRQCATHQKVMGLIPHGVTGIFNWHNSSGCPVALGLTQSLKSLTEMSTRNISWGVKAAGAWGWQSYHLHVLTVLKSVSLILLESSGPVQAYIGTALPFYLFFNTKFLYAFFITIFLVILHHFYHHMQFHQFYR
jgi:hypothetical protein